MFDIISNLRAFAEAIPRGWLFIYGNDQYANASEIMQDLSADQLVLVADLNVSPVYGKEGGINDAVFNGGVMLGQKREAETESNLDENLEQKYDRRLKNLTETLFISLGDFTCQYGYSITQINARYDINKFDENLDFIAATITFSTE
jgi:hypothetical protein